MMKVFKPKNCCYICGNEAKSKEHVPAKCFFPKDEKYRKQLMTVKSCKLHNEDTHLDDEYVRNIITTHHGNNSIAFKQFTNKVVKSFKININMIGKGRKIKTANGIVHAFEIDRVRFDKVIRKMAYALFFHKYRYQWNKELIILTEHLLYKDLSKDDYGNLLNSVKNKMPEIPTNGDNPSIFKYSFLENDNSISNSILQMTFYEGFTVWITTVIGSKTYKL